MAGIRDRQVVLLSIRPRFARAIMSGDKKVEFRRVRCSSDARIGLVYATSPIQRVIGFFEIAFVEEGTPAELWAKFGRVGEIAIEDYLAYYEGTSRAVAIGVGKVHHLVSECELREVEGCGAPPQSFQYLPRSALRSLPSRAQGVPMTF